MAHQTYLRYHQKCDVYGRTTATNAAGQEVASFAITSSGVPCIYNPVYSERRVQPYLADIEEIRLVIPHPYANLFDYGDRVRDISDRYGNVIEAGPYEIVEVLKSTGWNGKLSYITVQLRLVVEQ